MLAGSSEENLRQLFRAFDINRDGRISKEEMTTLISDLQLQEYNDDQDGLVKSGKLEYCTNTLKNQIKNIYLKFVRFSI